MNEQNTDYGQPKSVRMRKSTEQAVEKLADKYSMNKGDVSRLAIEWVCNQPDEVQHAVLMPLPASIAAAYADVLESMAKQLREKTIGSVPTRKRE